MSGATEGIIVSSVRREWGGSMTFQLYLPDSSPSSLCISANNEKCIVAGIESGENGDNIRVNPVSNKLDKLRPFQIGDMSYPLVGLDPGRKTCGHVPEKGVGACPDCGNTVKVRHLWCYCPSCRVCFKYGAENARSCARIVERLEACMVLYGEIGKPLGGVQQVIVSPPQEWALKRMETVGGMKYLRTMGYRLMRESGLKGGHPVFHAFRFEDWAKEAFKVAKKNGYEYGIWEWARENDIAYPGESIYFSPHFHIFGWGFLDNSDVFFKRTGWIYKKKVDAESGNVVYYEGEDLKRAVRYVLTHRSVISEPGTGKRLNMCNPIGVLSSHNIGKDENIEHVPDTCDYCNAELEHVEGWVEVQLPDGSYSVGCQGFDVFGKPIGFDLTGIVFPRWVRTAKYWLRDLPKYFYVVCSDWESGKLIELKDLSVST